MSQVKLKTNNVQQTIDLAESIGRALKGGETIELVSDLGGGKTTLVKGLARAIESSDEARSPSFTLDNVYQGKKLSIHHYDFYRLSEPGIMRSEISEVLADKNVVVVIEWPDIIEDVLPEKRIVIKIRALSENEREFVIDCPKELEYLLPPHEDTEY